MFRRKTLLIIGSLLDSVQKGLRRKQKGNSLTWRITPELEDTRNMILSI